MAKIGAEKLHLIKKKNSNTKRKHLTYMDPFPDWDFIQSHKFVEISLLQNDNLCDSIKFGNKHVFIRNTCAFDSFVQLLTHAIRK